jgi:hypothetical protein
MWFMVLVILVSFGVIGTQPYLALAT